MIGVVRVIKREMGYGFIQGDNGDQHFFHISGLHMPFNDLAEGDRVEFAPEEGPRGLRAKHVRILHR